MTIETARAEITLKDNAEATALLGQYNSNLKQIEKAFSTQIIARGETVRIEGESEEVERVRALFEKLLDLIGGNHTPSPNEVSYLIEQTKAGAKLDGVLSDVVRITHWGEEIRAKTVGQHRYVKAIRDSDVTFAIGPAGTGKTYLAVASAIDYLKSPYLRPLYDAMFDMIPVSEFEKLIEHGRIEMAPLAFMRGRTLNHSFVILDEAQNTTSIQMKMFLTRLGYDSKAIITGDITQVDLEEHASGLITVQEILSGIQGISFVYLDRSDVVRHPLVARIIEAYERTARPRPKPSPSD